MQHPEEYGVVGGNAIVIGRFYDALEAFGGSSRHKYRDGHVRHALLRSGECGVVVECDHGTARATPGDFLDGAVLVARGDIQVYGGVDLVAVVHGFRRDLYCGWVLNDFHQKRVLAFFVRGVFDGYEKRLGAGVAPGDMAFRAIASRAREGCAAIPTECECLIIWIGVVAVCVEGEGYRVVDGNCRVVGWRLEVDYRSVFVEAEAHLVCRNVVFGLRDHFVEHARLGGCWQSVFFDGDGRCTVAREYGGTEAWCPFDVHLPD